MDEPPPKPKKKMDRSRCVKHYKSADSGCFATVVVRCLGPGAEHTFKSTDECGHRICNDCRRKLEGEYRVYQTPGE